MSYLYLFFGIPVVIILAIFYWLPKSLIRHVLSKYPSIRYKLNTLEYLQLDDYKKKVMITIDDVPYSSKISSESFEKILDALKKWNLKVIFFVISGQVTNPNRLLLVRAIKEGHELHNHGKTDRRHSNLSKEDLLKEILYCDQMLDSLYEEANVRRPSLKYYRPGCGTFNQMMIDECYRLKHIILLGNNYPHDPFMLSSYINFWYIKQHLEDGDIIIIHDRSWTPNLIDKLGYYLRKEQYEVVQSLL